MPSNAALADDAEAIPDKTLLFRRVDWDRVGGKAKTAAGATPSLNANCFQDYKSELALQMGYPDACMSVAADSILQDLGLSPEQLLANYPGYGLAAVRAGDLRNLLRADRTACPQGIQLRPTEDEPWHAVVFDMDPAMRPRKNGVAKRIAAAAYWVIPLVNDAS